MIYEQEHVHMMIYEHVHMMQQRAKWTCPYDATKELYEHVHMM